MSRRVAPSLTSSCPECKLCSPTAVLSVVPSCSLFFGMCTLCVGSHCLHEGGRGCSFERQSVANFTHDPLLQRLNEVDACVAACYFRGLQVQLSQFARSGERVTVRHNFGHHSPFVCSMRRQRLWVQQERLRSPRSSAITPGGKDSVTGCNARGEVGHILEGRAFSRDNDTRK